MTKKEELETEKLKELSKKFKGARCRHFLMQELSREKEEKKGDKNV